MTFKLRCLETNETCGSAPVATATRATTATNAAPGAQSVANVAAVAVAPPSGMARCAVCSHFEGRPGSEPDGWCNRLSVETWAAPLFQCDTYRPADDALVALARRRAEVVKQLREDPGLRYAFDVANASLTAPASAPVSVMLGVRDSSGAIVTAELRVPADRWPGLAAFAEHWRKAAEGMPS